MILLEDDIPTFSRLQQSMTPPNPTPPPSPSMYLHICKHGPILFAPTKADPSRGEGSHSPSGPSLRLPRRTVTKKEKGRGEKSLFSDNTIQQSVCLLVTNVRRRKKYIHRQLFWKSVLSLRLNAWVPPALSVLAIPPLHPRLQRGTCKHIS